MLAHDLVPALRTAGHVVTATGRGDLDVTDPAPCPAAAAGHDLVVNCAAWTTVDDAESHEAAGFRRQRRRRGKHRPRRRAHGARLVHLSTDYVFDGEATIPYAAEHLRPTLGLRADQGSQASGRCVRCARTAWSCERRGSTGQAGRTSSRRCCGSPGSATPWRSSTTSSASRRGPDLADLIVRLIAADPPGGVYHGTSTGETTWHGLARAVFEARGLDPQRVRPTTTDTFPRPAPRPAYSVLSHATLEAAGITPIRDWRAALRDFLGA